jgi:hypothetical protein
MPRCPPGVLSPGLIRCEVKLFLGPGLAGVIPLVVFFDLGAMLKPKLPHFEPHVLGNRLAFLPTVGLSIPVEAGAEKFELVLGELGFSRSA